LTFSIRLPLFEGPFDLLLFFIQRDELDIHDIPIAQITADFLAYLADLERLNIDVASEFMLVASTLMQIKAKMLLPRPEKDKEGNEIDPREALAIALAEYQKYKLVLGEWEKLEEKRLQKFERGNAIAELQQLAKTYEVDAELQQLTLYKLFQAYTKVCREYEGRKPSEIHSIIPYPYSVAQHKEFILSILQEKSVCSFQEIIGQCPDKIAVIFTFLALLELIQVGKIDLKTDEINDEVNAEITFNQFEISAICDY